VLAARLPGNSTYDNPRCGQIRGCRGLPHSLAPLTGRPGRWPCSAGRTCIQERQGKRRQREGRGGCRGCLWRTTPGRAGPGRCRRGLPDPRNRFTSPGIKATPLTFLLDRIVRDDESGAEAALRIVRQFRQRGGMVVSVQESWLNGSPEMQDIFIAFAGGWLSASRPGTASGSRQGGHAGPPRARRPAVRPARRTRASAGGRAASGRGKRAARGARRRGRG